MMGMTMIIKILVEGGSMSPGPALSQKLGPAGININQVIQKVWLSKMCCRNQNNSKWVKKYKEYGYNESCFQSFTNFIHRWI